VKYREHHRARIIPRWLKINWTRRSLFSWPRFTSWSFKPSKWYSYNSVTGHTWNLPWPFGYYQSNRRRTKR
jgi:hypothetical protein